MCKKTNKAVLCMKGKDAAHVPMALQHRNCSHWYHCQNAFDCSKLCHGSQGIILLLAD
jgi:hypothetical protein